jgi:myo-inositol-1(or 4)-monophosphatase
VSGTAAGSGGAPPGSVGTDRALDLSLDLDRIAAALSAAAAVLGEYTPGAVAARRKVGDDPVTEADTRVDTLLREMLPRAGEGWLSEETEDDPSRLACRRVWVVDPLDGTREFVEGIAEWSVSIGLVEDGRPVAGGVLNPATGEQVLGAVGLGVTLGGSPAAVSTRQQLAGARVLASRSEVKRGEWQGYRPGAFELRPVGSVAYKLALVAAGLADATWTLTPKHEWDVAAGVALVLAGGGFVRAGRPEEERFNRPHPLLSSLLATGSRLVTQIDAEIAHRAAGA